VETSKTRPQALRAVLIGLIALVTCVLIWDTFLVNDVLLVTRAAIIAALLVGLVGTWSYNRVVRLVTAFVAWAGLGLYFLFIVVTIVPGEMTRLAGYPPDQPISLLLERLCLLVILGVASSIVYFRLHKAVRDSR
jgi:hypothetical protein